MTRVQLPGGGRAWFVRYRKRWGCGMKPASMEGRLLTAAYAAWISGLTWYFANRDVDAVLIALWITITVVSTFFYIVTALRMSAPASGSGKGGC